MWSRLILGLVVAALASACTEPATDDPVKPSLSFEVGEPLSDPAIAARVASDLQVDTLSSQQFNRNIIRLASMFPDVMADPQQEAQIKREIVKQFVVERLIMAEAQKNGVAVDSAAVARRLEEYRSSFPNEKAFQEELDRFQQSVTDLEDQFRVELTRQAISRLVEQQTGEPTEAQIDSFRTSLAERIRAQHILFMVDETMDESMSNQVMDEARSVLDSALSGVNFGDLARRHSDDVGTAQVGGELPWFRRGEMVQEFEDAVFGLESPGDITDHLVETNYGYHIIRLIDRVVDEPIPVDSARALLWKRQVRQAERNLIEGLQANAEVRVNPNLVPGLAAD